MVGNERQRLAAILISTSDAVVVTVFADDNKKYLTTDLLREEPAREDYLTPEIKLTGYTTFKRVCYTCCDPKDCLKEELPSDHAEWPKLPACPRRR